MDFSNRGNVLGNMETSIDELWSELNLPPIDQTNPILRDFSWQQAKTDLGPLQDCNWQQETPELLAPHVETNCGAQFNQAAEPSPEPSRRGRRAKLSEFQRRENKRNSDKKHRQKQKEWLVFQPRNANAPAAAVEFFRKLEEDKESSIDLKDFTDLDEKQEYRTVGKYQIPLSLVPTAEEITEVYGDVCATSTISRNHAGKIYILFCATIKEMNELPLEKVTEKTMLKWRDAIKDALCVKFKVEFAMEHLKKTVAPRYFGMKACEEAEKIDVDISKVEAYLNGLKECKKFIGIAKEFDDKPFGEGLWR